MQFLNYSLWIQFTFFEQSLDEINDFILELKKRDYKGFLHIFPRRYHNKPLNLYLNYDKLEKVDFLPRADYFRRWKFIYENGKRDFVCDFLKNGYVYHVTLDEIKMVKCDCSPGSFRYEHPFEEERQYKVFPCGTCITHFEYNNSRKIVNE